MALILRIASHRIASHRINIPIKHLEKSAATAPPRHHILIPCGTEHKNLRPARDFLHFCRPRLKPSPEGASAYSRGCQPTESGANPRNRNNKSQST